MPSPCVAAFSPISARFPMPKSTFTTRNQEGMLAMSATLSTTTAISLQSTPSSNAACYVGKSTARSCPKERLECNGKSGIGSVEHNNARPIIDKRNSRLQVQNLISRIKSLPTAQRTRIIEMFEGGGGSQTVSDFNELLMAFVKADETELALKLYSNLSSYGLVPDYWTFSIIIWCQCKTNDPSHAKRVLDHMVENGFQPHVSTFTVLINTLCRAGRVQEAFEILGLMGRVHCDPTIQTYNCLLKGLCYVGRVEEAYEFLISIKKSSMRPDIYTYTAVMDGLCKVGQSKEAVELLDEAVEMGLSPNVVTFNTLFNGYFKEGRPLEGIALLKQMKGRNCGPDYISYCTLLHGLLKWGEIKAAFGVYEEMVDAGFKVDERMMNTLLRGLCRGSRTDEELARHAYQVLDRMTNGGYSIYHSTYGLVIEAFCTGKEVDRAAVSLQEMVKLGYAPTIVIFNRVIGALCSVGRVEAALPFLIHICKGNRIPSRSSFDILISGFNRRGMSRNACSVYGAALKNGVIPQRRPT